jgi:hypothetical protein
MVRKAKARRDQERYEADRREWEIFRPKLEALQTYPEAQLLVLETPPPDPPGRKYYSNLSFFLGAFSVPGGASYAEKALYLKFIQRLDDSGALKPCTGQIVEEALRRFMNDQGT